MSQMLEVNANGIDELLVPDMYDADGVIRAERTLTPLVDLSWIEVAVEPLVAGKTFYQIEDPTGTTDHYYRTRFTTSGGGRSSTYSTPFRAGTLTAYASLDDLKEMLEIPTAKAGTINNLLIDYLVRASNMLDEICGRDFYRHPQVSGTETRTWHVKHRGRSNLADAIGSGVDIVSIDSMSIAASTGAAPTALTQGTAGYFLEPSYPQLGWPHEDVILSNIGSSFYYFPTGYGVVSITGVFGWPAIPPLVQQAVIEYAGELFRRGPGGGGPVGINQFGTPVFGPGTPESVVKAYTAFRRQSFVWVG